MSREQRAKAHDAVIEIQRQILALRNACRDDDDLYDLVDAQVNDWACIENKVMRYAGRSGELAGSVA